MGKVIEFPQEDGGRERETKKERTDSSAPLSQEEFSGLLEPLKEGLKRLYPSQVKEVLGVIGLGEKNGRECFVGGLLAWTHFKHSQPILSTFLAVFVDNQLEKISFLEAKNNYWDWELMIKTYKTRFDTENIYKELIKLREQVLKGRIQL